MSLALGACSPKKDRSFEDDPLERSYRKIDTGDYNGAIAELEELAATDQRPRVKEALASAYAARAGLFIEKYWGFMVGFQAPLLSSERVESATPFLRVRKILSQLDGEVRQTGNDGLAKLSRFVATLHLWIDRIDRLPTVGTQGRKDVQRALKVLEGGSARGARLYRALLGLVIFKSDINAGFDGWARVEQHLSHLDFARPESLQNKVILCEIDVKSFARWAGGMLRRLSETAEDVIVAFPSKAEEMRGALGTSWSAARDLEKAGGSSCL